MNTEDVKIVRLCKGNKREGFNQLFEKYERYIYSLCFRYTSSREDALDLLQDIYIKIYKSFSSFKEGQPLLPWIKRITVNTCLNFVTRRKNSNLSLNAQLDDGSSLEDRIASSDSVDDEVIYHSTRKALEDAIQNLPGDMKMAVILRHLEGMSYDNIAKAMSSPVGTVKTLLFRGRRILREQLKAAGVWEV